MDPVNDDRPRSPRPSEAMRARLRADVEAAFRPSVVARVGRALRRPIPLYQGLVAAALAVALALPLARGKGSSGVTHGAQPPEAGLAPSTSPPAHASLPGETALAPILSGARVDTARLSPESLTIY